MPRRITVVLITLLTPFVFAQTQRMGARGGGGGEISPTVVMTFETADGKLELLVLWRGTPGWLQAAPSRGGANQSFIGAGSYPMRSHVVSARGKPLELRIDENNVAH